VSWAREHMVGHRTESYLILKYFIPCSFVRIITVISFWEYLLLKDNFIYVKSMGYNLTMSHLGHVRNSGLMKKNFIRNLYDVYDLP
jgi:hypothetical protein